MLSRQMAACGLAIAITGTLLFRARAEDAPPANPASSWNTWHKALAAFHSDDDLRAFLKRVHKLRPPPPPPAPPPPAEAAMTENAVAGSPARGASSITNNQVGGVDEGDIVKLTGGTLVVLRRGRLYTISIVDGQMHAVDSINAYPPGVDARADWYDEMLVAGDLVAVVGYSYGRGGTEINRFHLDRAGRLTFEDSYHLRSNDYYSSRNYASRLIGNRLVFYSPSYLPYGEENLSEIMPALSRWNGGSSKFERINTAREVYLSPGMPDDSIEAMHTVTSCDLTEPVLHCKATAVFGPAGRTFFVSANAVYVWTTLYWSGRGNRASGMLYRLPLDGGAPSAIGVRGAPADQFAFNADASRDELDVLVRDEGAGDAMWASELSQGAVALLDIPLRDFGDGTQEVPFDRYRTLPRPKGQFYAFHERFVGDDVLYGEGSDWGAPQDANSEVIVAPVHGSAPVVLPLPHGVDRIEAMGRDAVVVGADSRNLFFSTVALGGKPALGDQYVMAGASQSETRSHGFFYQPEAGADSGVLGLPVARPAREGFRQLFEDSASIVFVRRDSGRFHPLGELASHPENAVDDSCVASCVDWYGNARPIFAYGRTFALMGYELVEGRAGRDSISEIDRLDFAPIVTSPRNAQK